MQAEWNGKIVASSNDVVTVEGNAYFPRTALADEFITASARTSVCPWKGTAEYYNLQVDGKTNLDSVWYYADPKPAAENIRGRVAFWKGVKVTG